jgi:hypothetical protein
MTTFVQAGAELRIYRDGKLLASFSGVDLVNISRAALSAFAEGNR